MNIYGRDTDLKFPIVVHNDQPSEYADLVQDYLDKGGKITVVPEGEKTDPKFDTDEEYLNWGNRTMGAPRPYKADTHPTEDNPADFTFWGWFAPNIL